ncbi:MAG: AAA family ATPase [Candidatus Schekmanbacteria bacterium]|nr:AAA family ATPase [Candidatus Schekmanbacteria bacterium]
MQLREDILRLNEAAAALSSFVDALRAEVASVLVGQEQTLRSLLVGLLAGGHVLLEGVPGLAKTLAVRTMARALNLSYRRVQFTPDLLPADIVGTMVWNPGQSTFEAKPGPVFAHVVLADEINRAPAKVQSALLEAMEERTVTLGDTTHPLPRPFLVLATQNPVEQEGTYPLPEAQIDRFMLKVEVTYPSREEEREILDRMTRVDPPAARPVVRPEQIREALRLVRAIHVDDRIKDYIVALVRATRDPDSVGLRPSMLLPGADREAGASGQVLAMTDLLRYGCSPRATIFLTQAARAQAFLDKRGFVTPSDVRAVAIQVLRHRISVSYEGEARGLTADLLLRAILAKVPLP